MDKILKSSSVLITWKSPVNENELKKLVDEIKNVTNLVSVENVDRLDITTYAKASCDIVISCKTNPQKDVHNLQVLSKYIELLKPGGSVILYETNEAAGTIKSKLILSGFTDVVLQSKDNVTEIQAKKPNFEVGSSCSIVTKTKVPENVASLWKLSDTIDDQIEADELILQEDFVRPDSSSLRVCETTGKRKACKDCSCGLAEEIAGEAVPIKTSSCGSCYLGDAFRCSSCPYLGMPAFKLGEKVVLPESQLKADL